MVLQPAWTRSLFVFLFLFFFCNLGVRRRRLRTGTAGAFNAFKRQQSKCHRPSFFLRFCRFFLVLYLAVGSFRRAARSPLYFGAALVSFVFFSCVSPIFRFNRRRNEPPTQHATLLLLFLFQLCFVYKSRAPLHPVCRSPWQLFGPAPSAPPPTCLLRSQ